MLRLVETVPWGRSFAEYEAMFALSRKDLHGRIVGVGDGPASFNAELTERGGNVISIDPLYQFNLAGIKQRIDETYPLVLALTRQNATKFVWNNIPSVEALGTIRMRAMRRFVHDYANKKRPGRYIAAQLPVLPFAQHRFDLALCSHFLFLYSAQFTLEFHLQGVLEMCRVAREVRVFPLLDLEAARSPYLEAILAALKDRGLMVSIETVPYEFQRGGNQMLRVKSAMK